MTLPLDAVARAMRAAPIPTPVVVQGWSVDSRTVQPGDLFFALRGPCHDGHDHAAEALAKGAAAVVVERPVSGGAELLVPDTVEALQAAARWARDEWNGTVVGVTGSAGKTTTKDAIAHLLETAGPVGRTVGNLNNHVGIPLSILRLPDACRTAVLEMGMNHAGEIRQLAAIARPLVGVVTNVGYAHVEFFDSIEGVAAAKRELIEALPDDGVAVLNADDERVRGFAAVHSGPVVTYGFREGADVRAEDARYDDCGSRFRVGDVEFETALAGRHGVQNLLAALAVARVMALEAAGLREAVRSFRPGKMRGERIEHAGITILNDCYNSNPEAARAMLDVLAATAASRRIAVLGEMLELGHAAEELHREIGRYAAGRGVDLLIGVQGAARYMVEEAAQAGAAAQFYEKSEQAGEAARRAARSGDAVLLKGSRGVRVERALERLVS